MSAKTRVRNVLHRFGYDLHRFETGRLTYTRHLLAEQGIKLVIDVGANEGQFAQQLRTLGYRDLLWSFEPGTRAFRQLERQAAGDSAWKLFPVGLSDETGTQVLNISENSVSSSLLPMAELHQKVATRSKYVRREAVQVATLDELAPPPVPIWLKIDTQGTELPVLRGASTSLAHVRVLQLEISLAHLYEGQARYDEIVPFILDQGFVPAFIESALQDAQGRMLQVDGIFVRIAA